MKRLNGSQRLEPLPETAERLDAAAINDLIALYGGGSLKRQFKAGAKRGIVYGVALFLIIAFVFALPLLIAIIGIALSGGHFY
jgi:hypothetical protein